MRRFGFAFGETFVEAKRRQREFSRRLAVVYVLGGGLVLLLLGRLGQLQIVQGVQNRERSENNRIEVERVKAPRGTIFDRNGVALTRNVPIYKWTMDNGPIRQAQGKQWTIVSREEGEKLKNEGEEVVEEVGREYLYASVMGHVVGYLGEISEEGLAGAEERCVGSNEDCEYRLGDLVGKLGAEKAYEEVLKGQDGGEIVERGADGKVLRMLSVRGANVGRDVSLTLDLGLQQRTVEILGNRKGAVVVSDPASGEVLALVSSPGFDPNLFSEQKAKSKEQRARSNEQREDILASEDKPLFNRVTAGLYPPGSVFKIVTAVAGLEEREIDASTEIEDIGEIKVGEFRYGNWYFDQYGRKEGFLDLVGAIKRSNDIFFYKVGEKLGAEKMAEWAGKFGFGEVAGLDLFAEAEGVVPSPEWKERVKGERWFLGNTYHFAIGQGDLQVTPLQVHQASSIVAANGKLCKPRFVKENQGIIGGLLSPLVREASCEELGISEEALNLVKQGMVEACKPRGTAFPFFNFSVSEASPSGEIDDEDRVACKTGTAQFGDPQDRTHAWFVAFGPSDRPEILVTVLLEAAGEGSYEAAPVAKEIMDYWFHERS